VTLTGRRLPLVTISSHIPARVYLDIARVSVTSTIMSVIGPMVLKEIGVTCIAGRKPIKRWYDSFFSEVAS
jgi:hypothetical protein